MSQDVIHRVLVSQYSGCVEKNVETKFLSLHSSLHYHRIGRLEPNVLHPDSSGARGQVLLMDSHTSGV